MKCANWPVEDYGIRPAGRPDQCFYCHEPKGGTHKPDCVIRQRTVVVEVSLQLVVSEPEDWDADQIEHFFNDSSSCQLNIINRIVELAERLEATGRCPCGLIDVKYLREATADDEEEQQLFVERVPS